MERSKNTKYFLIPRTDPPPSLSIELIGLNGYSTLEVSRFFIKFSFFNFGKFCSLLLILELSALVNRQIYALERYAKYIL